MDGPPALSGYGDPYEFEYPTLRLQLVGTVLTVGCLVGYGWLAAVLRGGEFGVTLGPEMLVVMLATFVATIVVHEAVHGAVARLLGYQVSFGVAWSMLAAYAASFEQPISRRDNAIVAAAPLAVMTPVGVALLTVAEGPLLLAVYLLLVVNTGSAIGDLYLLYRLARMPAGTVLYDLSTARMFVYEPAAGDAGPR